MTRMVSETIATVREEAFSAMAFTVSVACSEIPAVKINVNGHGIAATGSRLPECSSLNGMKEVLPLLSRHIGSHCTMVAAGRMPQPSAEVRITSSARE